MTKLLRLKVVSNLVFIIPLVLALTHKIYLHAFIIGLVFLVSTLHHYNNEKFLDKTDTLLAATLICINILIWYQFKHLPFYFYSVIALSILSGYVYFHRKKGEYEILHPVWHLVASLITIICIVGYVQIG